MNFFPRNFSVTPFGGSAPTLKKVSAGRKGNRFFICPDRTLKYSQSLNNLNCPL